MNREKQLKYCKKCINQKFSSKQGIICSLTNQKADFEDECENFEIDKVKIEKISERNERIEKSRIAYGFSPKQIDNIGVADLSEKQSFVLAYEAVKELGWNIGFVSESGFIAYTNFSMSSWSEEVQIKIEVGNIYIKSECTGSQFIDWGKNRKNIDAFISVFKKIRSNAEEIEIDETYLEISKEFINKEKDDIINQSPLSRKEKVSGMFSLFIPTEGYFVTPILLNLNIVIFIIMILSGINFMLPSGESLILWGANFKPVTLDGEYWRLVSSMFLHIGVFHLLMNMYALIYIGLLLEPYLGKSRFLSAYILSGIVGSISSLYWNDLTISAGASGAIFGMYGVFLAMLTTNLIEKSARKALLTSIVVFVGYNLLNGLKGDGGIDNAAHVGGLVSGLIIGYSFYPSLIKIDSPKLKPTTIGLLTILILSSSFVVVTNLPNEIGKYEKEMEKFVLFEEKALEIYSLPTDTPNVQFLSEIKHKGIYNWNQSIKLLDSVDKFDLPDEIHFRNSVLKDYCELRIKSYNTIYKAISEDTNRYDEEIEEYNEKIEAIINKLTKQ